MFFLRIFLVFTLCFNSTFALCLEKNEFINHLTFDELVELSKTEDNGPELNEKLQLLLNSPLVDNTIAPENTQLHHSPLLGDFVRVGSWNISRGRNLNLIKMIFDDKENFYKRAKNKELKKIQEEIKVLENLDILIVNEADIGMPRTRYRNVPEELGKILGFNYAFGVEYVEVDPVHLGLEKYEWSEEKFLFPNEEYVVDKQRYKGLHGNAILSRFPLKNVRVVRLTDYYDWFNDEKDRVVQIEVARRKAAKLIFSEAIFREIRRGSRMALLADVKIPGAEKPLTVVAVHLENRTISENRHKQTEELLKSIRNINNPIVMGGDFNTTCSDGRPTTIKREIKKRITSIDYMGKQIINLLIPQAMIFSASQLAVNITRKHSNPTVMNIPIISPNPERLVFRAIKDMIFTDRKEFDFEGDMYRSVNNNWGMLSASNHRRFKGFVPTYEFERNFYIGKFKLDWLFVKPGENSFAPFFGRTLYNLNYSTTPPISDHVPITVDLPINTPTEDELEDRIDELERLKDDLEEHEEELEEELEELQEKQEEEAEL